MHTSAPTTPREAYRAIKILFYGLVIGVVLFAGVTFGYNAVEQQSPLRDKSVGRIFFIISLFLAAVCVTAANYLYKKRIVESRQHGLSLMDKLNIYRAALILYISLCEAAALFALIMYFLTGNQLLLVVTGLMLLAMLLKLPQKSRIFNELQLDSKEQMELI